MSQSENGSSEASNNKESINALIVNLEENTTKEIETEEKTTLNSTEEDGETINSSEDWGNTDLIIKNNHKSFICDKCSISFVSPVYLKAHKNRCRARDEGVLEHSILTPTVVKKRRNRKCQVPSLKCDTCGKLFVHTRYLDAHVASHKTEFKCEKCPYVTEFRRNLMRHIVVHFGDEEKKYSCPHCEYMAGKASYLRIHIAMRHSDEKPHKCTVCSYKTKLLDTLKKHMATHTGDRAYACSHCYYSAAKKSALAKHLEKFHADAEESNTRVENFE